MCLDLQQFYVKFTTSRMAEKTATVRHSYDTLYKIIVENILKHKPTRLTAFRHRYPFPLLPMCIFSGISNLKRDLEMMTGVNLATQLTFVYFGGMWLIFTPVSLVVWSRTNASGNLEFLNCMLRLSRWRKHEG